MPELTGVATPDPNGNYTEFDAAYWLHQSPSVRRLPGVIDFEQRTMEAIVLAEQGFLIDVPIMVWGWDPGKIMASRITYGYTSVPALSYPPVTIAPGVNQNGKTGSGNTGQILVSLNYADYPPYVAV